MDIKLHGSNGMLFANRRNVERFGNYLDLFYKSLYIGKVEMEISGM